MAAQILSLSIDKKKQLAIFLPDENAVQHTECYESFIRACITHGISSTVLCRASLKDKIITYEATEQIINNNKNIGGIYVASNNAVGVCKCLEDMGRTDIAVLGHDLYPELAECITRGSLLATLFQNQSLQVKRAVEKMIEYITNEKKPFGTVFLRPELVMKSNLDCYTDQY
jgi:ABC-type sugar transport system substrate-binding protein